MKVILIPIKPKWVKKILNGEKTIEIRKTMPKCNLPIDVYIYCTKDKLGLIKNLPSIYRLTKKQYNILDDVKHNNGMFEVLNGKVVAKFTLRKVEEIYYNSIPDEEYCYYTDLKNEDEEDKVESSIILGEESCLSDDELDDYLNGQTGYAYHIEDLVIFDKPKELNNFMPIKWKKCGIKDKNDLYQCHKCPYGEVLPYGGECHYKPLTKAPQNFMYIESEE